MHKGLASGCRFSFQCSSNHLTRAKIIEERCPKGFGDAGNALACRLLGNAIEKQLLKLKKKLEDKMLLISLKWCSLKCPSWQARNQGRKSWRPDPVLVLIAASR